LTDQLRQLERDGVIQRRVSSSVPPAVTYSLNTEGEKLVPMMASLCDWGSAHFHMKPSLPRLMQGNMKTGESTKQASPAGL
jgi:DNA-binding HxlR family transcriptional regulator